jgi:hypothetical protein
VHAWCPAPAEPHRLGWYEPAAALGQALRAAVGAHLPLDDLRFLGRIDRTRGPALWAYERPGLARMVLVDLGGVPHHAVDDRRRREGHRFEPIPLTVATELLGLAEGPAVPTSGGLGVVLPFRRR